jgi:ABC-type spermidine/putrescine transport system permease subunit I
MKKAVRVMVLAAVVGALCVGQAQAAKPKVTLVLLGTALSDSGNNVKGFAGFQSITRNNQTKTYFEIALGNLSVPANTTLNVLINGTPVATATTRSSRGSTTKAKLLLSSPRGDTVPAVTAGATITIVEAAGGTTIATGTFRQFK